MKSTIIIKYMANFFISIVLLSCQNDLVSNRDTYRKSIIGTWQEDYNWRLDPLGEVYEECSMDTVRTAISSIFENNIQKLIVDTLDSDFHFVLFYHFELDEIQLTRYPDSLLTDKGNVHYWNQSDGFFYPYYPVLAKIYSANINRIDQDILQERRQLSDGTTLIIDYKRISSEPNDLTDNFKFPFLKAIKKSIATFFDHDNKILLTIY